MMMYKYDDTAYYTRFYCEHTHMCSILTHVWLTPPHLLLYLVLKCPDSTVTTTTLLSVYIRLSVADQDQTDHFARDQRKFSYCDQLRKDYTNAINSHARKSVITLWYWGQDWIEGCEIKAMEGPTYCIYVCVLCHAVLY